MAPGPPIARTKPSAPLPEHEPLRLQRGPLDIGIAQGGNRAHRSQMLHGKPRIGAPGANIGYGDLSTGDRNQSPRA